jgi:hypothetical protein
MAWFCQIPKLIVRLHERADRTWTKECVESESPQVAPLATYRLRSREPLREPHPLLIMPASDGTASPQRSDRYGANARALPNGRQ